MFLIITGIVELTLGSHREKSTSQLAPLAEGTVSRNAPAATFATATRKLRRTLNRFWGPDGQNLYVHTLSRDRERNAATPVLLSVLFPHTFLICDIPHPLILSLVTPSDDGPMQGNLDMISTAIERNIRVENLFADRGIKYLH